MPTLQHSEKLHKLSIRCTRAFKRAVMKAAIDRDQSIERFCAELISKELGIPTQSRKTKSKESARPDAA